MSPPEVKFHLPRQKQVRPFKTYIWFQCSVTVVFNFPTFLVFLIHLFIGEEGDFFPLSLFIEVELLRFLS